MKTINLLESQLERLLSESIENFGENPIPEFQNKEKVTTQSKKTDDDGEIEDSNPVIGDKFAHQQMRQQYGYSNRYSTNPR